MKHPAPRAPWTPSDILAWIAAPICALFALSLACTTAPPADDGSSLTPDELRAFVQAKALLLGRWTLTHEVQARDEVGRPLPAGAFSWTIEIFEVEPLPFGANQLQFRWSGALKAERLCVVDEASFVPQGAPCQPLEPALLGRCVGHACESFLELPIQGSYQPDLDQLRFDSVEGNAFFLDPERGFINLSTQITGTLTFESDTLAAAPTCEGSCGFTITPKGLFTGQYRNYSDNLRVTTLTRLDDLRRKTPTVDETPRATRIDEQAEAVAAILGSWRLTIGLEDDFEPGGLRAVGEVGYDLDVFEVVESSEVGAWQFRAGANVSRLCVATQADANAGRPCGELAPAQVGTCGSTCTPGDEIAVEGLFNTLDGALRINRVDADVFFEDARGHVALNVDIVADGLTLVGDAVEVSQCTSGCSWQIRASGELDDSHGDRDGTTSVFQMHSQ